MIPGRAQQTVLGLNAVNRRRTGRHPSKHGTYTKAPANLRPHVITGLDLGDQPRPVDRPDPHVHWPASMSWPNDSSSTKAANRRRTPCTQAAAADTQRQQTPRSEGLSQRRCWSRDGSACFTQQRSRALGDGAGGGATSSGSPDPGAVDYQSGELQSASRLRSFQWFQRRSLLPGSGSACGGR